MTSKITISELANALKTVAKAIPDAEIQLIEFDGDNYLRIRCEVHHYHKEHGYYVGGDSYTVTLNQSNMSIDLHGRKFDYDETVARTEGR